MGPGLPGVAIGRVCFSCHSNFLTSLAPACHPAGDLQAQTFSSKIGAAFPSLPAGNGHVFVAREADPEADASGKSFSAWGFGEALLASLHIS